MANGENNQALVNPASPLIFQEAQRLQDRRFTQEEQDFISRARVEVPDALKSLDIGENILLRRLGAAARGEMFRGKPLPDIDKPSGLIRWFVEQAGKSPPKI